MKKFLMAGSMMVLLSSQVGYGMSADIDAMLKELGAGGDISFADLSDSGVSESDADAERLLGLLYSDASRGENVSLLKEYQGRLWNSRTWYWDDPVKKEVCKETDDSRSCSLIYAALKPQQLKQKTNEKIKNVLEYYFNLNNGLQLLNLDIKALEYKVTEINNLDLKAKLESLLSIAKTAYKLIHAQNMKKKVAEKFDNLKPTADKYSLADALSEAQLNYEMAKKGRDQVLIAVCDLVVKKLKSIETEVDKLKRMNNDSIDDALKKAEKAKHAAVGLEQIELYEQVVFVLAEEQKKENLQFLNDQKVQEEADSIVSHKIQTISAADALSEINDELDALKKDLKLLQSHRNEKNKVKIEEIEKNIKIKEKVLIKLKEEAKKVEVENKQISKRVEDLLAKHDEDITEAVKEAQSKVTPARGAQSKNKIDREVLKVLKKQLNDEKEIAKKNEAEIKAAKEGLKERIDFHSNAIDALADAEKGLSKLQDLRQELVDFRNPAYKSDIKRFDDKIIAEKKIIEALKIEVSKIKKEESKITKLADDLVKKHDGNAKKALEEAQEKSNKSTATETEKQVTAALVKKIAEDKKNDPLKIALAKYKKAKVLEIPAALEAVVEASLAKQGLSINKLSPATRQELVDEIKNSSDKLIAVATNPRMSEISKQQQKNNIAQAMVKKVGVIILSYVSGADQSAVNQGVYAAGISAATNKVVNWLVPENSLDDDHFESLGF